MDIQPLTVTEFTRKLKILIQEEFSDVYITGEISNFKKHAISGHCYFTLKDENAALQAVLWNYRYNLLNFTPEDGLKVIVRGKITVYEPRGNYQIDIIEIRLAGIGELQLAFERLKRKLEEEGLFEESRKRALPEFPNRIGIITSESGAVIEDFKRVTLKRYPLVDILLFPVSVQGPGSVESIICALKEANKEKYSLDIIVLARGGGSIEDLWSFNDERLAREVFKSKVPTVSAIGHETDFTICDFVADLRAPTPSAAAEIIFPDKNQLLERLTQIDYYINDSIKSWFRYYYDNLDRIKNSYVMNRPVDILNQYKIRLDENYKMISDVLKNTVNKYKERLNYMERLLLNTSPEHTLKRGFAYVKKDGKVVSRKALLKPFDNIDIVFYDGTIGAEILKEKPEVKQTNLYDNEEAN
ncbi:MAG: exodeoxyribonuclease VII large subunit [Ignavibacteria bacterium]|nr:exodeoxyribonuclease VII large subunit [Ignavibacteria bacterium]